MKTTRKNQNRSINRVKNLFTSHNYKYFPIVVIVLLILLKLYLVSGQTLYAISHAGHDDRLFLTLAENLLHLKWLGEYNNLTLAKGMFYPLWIAISFLLGLPLLFSEQLLYISGCILFTIAIRPLIKNSWLMTILFTLMLFNPVTYANGPYTRVIREGVYVSLSLITFSSIIGLFARRHNFKKAMPWSLLLGVFLSSLWLTREEGIWIVPIFIILCGFMFYEAIKHRKKTLLKKNILLTLLPLLFLFISILLVSSINLYYYNTFTTVEFKSNSFVSAYGALSRVTHSKPTIYVPVPKETRMRIYDVSPAFKEIEVYLEGSVGDSWINIPGSDEIHGGWFMWALRDAVAYAGYYKDGSTSQEYYSRLASEINIACEEKRIECLPGERNSMNPPWEKQYIEPFTQNLKNALFYTIKFSGFTPYSSPSGGNSQLMILFQDLTMENINPMPGEPSLPNQTTLDGYKMQTLKLIGNIYIKTTPIFLASSILFMGWKAFNDIRKKKLSDTLIITLGLLSILASRIFIIVFIHTTSFNAINILYLSPAHVVMVALVGLVWVDILNDKFFQDRF